MIEWIEVVADRLSIYLLEHAVVLALAVGGVMGLLVALALWR